MTEPFLSSSNQQNEESESCARQKVKQNWLQFKQGKNITQQQRFQKEAPEAYKEWQLKFCTRELEESENLNALKSVEDQSLFVPPPISFFLTEYYQLQTVQIHKSNQNMELQFAGFHFS